ncbi:MAG: hypothetical protein ACJ8F7_20855 [Gemmataceae bacterium]
MPDKPDHVPPHDRFFEDGEEPPERYDLEDELEYIVPKEYGFDESRWFRIAGRHFRANWADLVGDVFVYLGVLALVGLCSIGLLSILLEPLLRYRLKSRYLQLLAGKPDEIPTAGRAWVEAGRFFGSQLPAYVCWLLTAVAAIAAHAMFQGLATPEWRPVVVVASTGTMAVVSFVVQVRLCGFSFELAFDHGLDIVQGLRASWRMTRPHARRLIALKARLWLLVLCAGGATLGFGLLFAVPYASLVWTAAYLDIAGSEPLIDPHSTEVAEPAN